MASTYDFPNHINGDTMHAINFTVTVNASALNLTGASIRMDLRNASGVRLKRFSTATADPGLTLTTPASGQFRFDEQIVDVECAGVHIYDIEITLASGIVETYISGNWTILQDVTHE